MEALQTLLPQPHQRAEEPESRRCPDGCPGAALPAAARPAGSPRSAPPPRHPSAAAPVPGRAQSRQQAAARRSRARRVPSMLGRSALAPPAAPGRRRGGPAAGAGRAARGPARAPGERGGGSCRPRIPHPHVGQRALGLVPIRSPAPSVRFAPAPASLVGPRQSWFGQVTPSPAFVLGILSPGLHHLITPWRAIQVTQTSISPPPNLLLAAPVASDISTSAPCRDENNT